jgi:hypothetical protein
MIRARYLIYFILSILFAFLTFQSFLIFKSDAFFSSSIIGTNTVILLFIWFFSFTAKSRFVQKNKVLIILIPILSIHILNLSLHISIMGTSLKGLAMFVLSSTGLVYTSYKASMVEKEFIGR